MGKKNHMNKFRIFKIKFKIMFYYQSQKFFKENTNKIIEFPIFFYDFDFFYELNKVLFF